MCRARGPRRSVRDNPSRTDREAERCVVAMALRRAFAALSTVRSCHRLTTRCGGHRRMNILARLFFSFTSSCPSSLPPCVSPNHNTTDADEEDIRQGGSTLRINQALAPLLEPGDPDTPRCMAVACVGLTPRSGVQRSRVLNLHAGHPPRCQRPASRRDARRGREREALRWRSCASLWSASPPGPIRWHRSRPHAPATRGPDDAALVVHPHCQHSEPATTDARLPCLPPRLHRSC